MKPKWSEAPEWANFLAMDADGKWWWFRNKPIVGDSQWVCQPNNMVSRAGLTDNGWRDTCEQRGPFKRYVVAKAEGSRFAYVMDTQNKLALERYDVMKGRDKRNGWNRAQAHVDRLNKVKENGNA